MRMDPEKMDITPNISSEDVAQQADALLRQVETRQRKVSAARTHIRAALRSAGSELPKGVRQELERFAEIEQHDKFHAHHEEFNANAQAEAQVILEEIVPQNAPVTIYKKQNVDLDMAGSFDEINTWTILPKGDITLLESKTRSVGFRSSKGNFDETYGHTLLIGVGVEKPLVFEGTLDKIPTRAGILQLSAFELITWGYILPELREIKEKFQVDRIADECSELLDGTFFEPGKWPGEKVRRVVAIDSSGTNLWQLAQVITDGVAGRGDFYITQFYGDEQRMRVKLDTDEGLFEAYPHRDPKDLFVANLAIVKTLLSQPQ